jgi:phospholipase/carboxylesterase
MTQRTEKISGLKCHIIDNLAEGTDPRAVVILCHGYGAPGTDLVPIGTELLKHPKLSGAVQFIFPEAPLSLDEIGLYGGRAWWPIDMMRLQMAVALGTFRDLRKDCPDELPAAREKMLGLVREWSKRSKLPISQFVLGGFSQGSMLATDVSLQLDENPAGLVILSGTLICEDTWTERAPHHKRLRAFQSHGMQDPLLPFAGAEWLKALLQRAGADVEFHPFHGGHEIPYAVMDRLCSFIKEAAGDGRTAN